MRKETYFLIPLLISLSIVGQEVTDKLPPGYRLPEKSDYPEYHQQHYTNNFPIKVNADFDGNGKSDRALLLIKSDNTGWCLFVFMNSDSDQTPLFKLDNVVGQVGKNLIMGISELKPGKYKTACGKGYWECQPNEPDILKLNCSGIDYFRFESANSVFYWDTSLKKFKRVWLSD